MLVAGLSRLRSGRSGGTPGSRSGHLAKAIGALLIAAVVAAPVVAAPAGEGAVLPPELPSPPGQVSVMTINAKQLYAVDLRAFNRIFQLVKAIRSRPSSFEGGNAGATGMPDVILFQEMRLPNLEIMHRLLNQRSKFRYEIVAADGVTSKFLYNSETMSLVGVPETWVDPCRTGVDGGQPKTYQFARFTENATGALVVVAGVHLKARYQESGQPQCREQNVQVMRSLLNLQAGPVIVGGDFNNRSMDTVRECDLDERSDPQPWYSMMTAPGDGGRPYIDSVRDWHRRRGASMADEWTFERQVVSTLCNGQEGFRRSRLDYLFAADAVVAEAHADHPGWAGAPGEVRLARQRYSDHRWVYGRFVLADLPRPAAPSSSAAAGGVVELAWDPAEGATSWVVYRGVGSRPYRKLATVTGDLTSYRDGSAQHGVTYRYAIAPVGADGGQGRESVGTAITADARGPRVIAVSPSIGERSASRFGSIRVWFDERIDPDSLGPATISLYRKRRPVFGRMRQESARVLIFNPNRKLRKKSAYRAVLRPIEDRLGNRGQQFAWRFRT